MSTMTVITEGLHVRPAKPDGSPNPQGESLDTLSKGDKLALLRISKDGHWLFGRVSEIQSGRFLADRLGREGWVWADAVRVNPVPAQKPALPAYGLWLGVAAIVAGLAYWAFGG